MKHSQFDKYHQTYDDVVDDSIDFMGVEHHFFTKAKADCLLKQLHRLYGDTRELNVLDVGCGVGKTDALLSDELKALSGVDVSSACVDRAKLENPKVNYAVYDGRSLPYEDDSFDAAFMICVLHHVPVPDRSSLMREVHRVIRPGGAAFVFEHNPYHLLTRIVVARCEFDRGVSLLPRREALCLLEESGFQYDDSQYILYVPFNMSWLPVPPAFRRLIPFGTQFFASGLKS